MGPRTTCRRTRRCTLLLTCSLLLGAPCVAGATPPSSDAPPGAAPTAAIERAVCPPAPPGHVRCMAVELLSMGRGNAPSRGASTRASGADAICALPREGCQGLRPQDLRSAYQLPAVPPSPQTIAIVAAGDDPRIQHDLGVYDAEFGLPDCTRANGCLTRLDGAGKKNPLPAPSAESANETSLDVEVAHAVCQSCRIVLVEASSTSLADVEEAVETAVSRGGANEVSISLGEGEPPVAPRAGKAFDHPGVVIAAAAGDTGYLNWASEASERGRAEYPASAPGVIAVGGTQLILGPGGEWAEETLWPDSGSGCSRLFEAPAWQRALPLWPEVGCGSQRAVADIAADGDPYTGAAVFDSFKDSEGFAPQWHRVGGTSLSTPIVAAAFALAGGANGVDYPARTLYANATRHPALLHDIAGASNGECLKLVQQECTVGERASSCRGQPICLAGFGYDGPSGLGSLDGIGALVPHREQLIAFSSTPPLTATVGGAPYTLTASATSGLLVVFSSSTSAVCSVEGALVRFLAAGTCTVDADQAGDAEWEAAPQVEQSFAVVFTTPVGLSEVLSLTSSHVPGAPLGPRFSLSGAPAFNRHSGAVSFAAVVPAAGELRWLITFANGSFGVVQGSAGGCGIGRVELRGGCRPMLATYAAGRLLARAGGVIHVRARPARSTLLALERARRSYRGLHVELLLVFYPASRGEASARLARNLTVRLARAPGLPH